MGFKTFRIHRLFNKYDITIKSNDKCVILLGANGIGKTTSLKILYNFFVENYVEIIAAPFKLLTIEDEDGTSYKVSYNDFLPPQKYMLEKYKEYLRRRETDRALEDELAESQFGSRKTIDVLTGEFGEALKQISRVGRYGEFIYCMYTKKPFSNIVLQVLNKYVEISELSQIEIKTTYLGGLFFQGSSLCVNSAGKLPFRKESEKCIFFDAVENYKISNELVYSSFLYDSDLEWIYSDVNAAAGNPDTVKRVFTKQYIKKSEISHNMDGIEKSMNVVISRDRDTVFDDLKANKVIRLNELINRNYYSVDLLLDINNRVSKYVEEYYESIDEYPIAHELFYTWDEYDENEVPLYRTVEEFYTDDIIRDYHEYVKPILIRHSFFDMVLRKDSHEVFETVNQRLSYGSFMHRYMKRKLLMDFLNEVLPILKDNKNRNPVINDYENVVRRYLVDKYVEIKPCGIQIREGSAILHDSTSLFVLFDKNDIDLSLISSGERKILMIFAVALFGQGRLFLDEPELSLSLIWQEALLPDVLKHGNLKSIFVATHSPYVSRAEELEQYLTFLPQRRK